MILATELIFCATELVYRGGWDYSRLPSDPERPDRIRYVAWLDPGRPYRSKELVPRLALHVNHGT